eukprot:515575_1
MNSVRLFWWIVLQLLPKCSPFPGPNSIIVLDNVSFHKYKPIKLICNYAQVKLIYLPPYSPHLNVIERLFNALKMNLQQYPLFCGENVRQLAHMIMQYKIKNINWTSVAKKIGYQYHVQGLN